VHIAATLFESICYANKDALSAGIIVAGWDKEVGPSVYNIPLGGGLFRQPWAIGGSGSTYVYGYCDATYKEGWGRDETVEFVKNSKQSHSPQATGQQTDVTQRLRWPWPVMARREA
jgi:20S proteasome subunit beta 1